MPPNGEYANSVFFGFGRFLSEYWLTLLILFNILTKFAVDILSLIMASTHNVGETTVHLAPLDVTTWLFVASIVDIMMIFTGCVIGISVDWRGFKLSELRDRTFGSGCWFELLLTLFYSMWIIFGIILMQQIRDTQLLVAVMFSWCIIQGITTVVVPLCLRVAQTLADKDKLLLSFDICSGFNLSDFSREALFLLIPLMLQIGGIAADIAALCIASVYDCSNDTSNGGSTLGSLDVNSWIFVGAITDMIIMIILWLLTWNELPGYGLIQDLCPFITSTLFHVLWSLFGFIMYADLAPEHSCSQIVLSWSMIQMLGTMFVCGCSSLFLYVILTSDDSCSTFIFIPSFFSIYLFSAFYLLVYSSLFELVLSNTVSASCELLDLLLRISKTFSFCSQVYS